MQKLTGALKTSTIAILLAFGAASLSACSTWEGFTNDVESTWDSIFGSSGKKEK